jgi:raffinose/stachyose/melibiose transport system permease protein
MDKILRDKKAIIFFIAPATLLFILILVGPILSAIYISLCDWDALSSPKFIGFGNYITMFTRDIQIKIALKNTFFIAIFSLVTQQIIGLLLAVILSNKIRATNFFKNTYYLPCVLSSAAIGLLFSFIFNPGMGINQLLANFGVKGPLWLMDIKGFITLPMWTIGMVATWQYMGQTMMLYMAAITGIPDSLSEAAKIDGANNFQVFKNITLPLIRPMTKVSISLTCIGSLKFFDLIWNMTKGGPSHYTEVLSTLIYANAFKYNMFGYASAISITLTALCLLVTFIINIRLKVEYYEI